MCLVLFVVSKILDSSELLSCLLELGVEYYLVCIKYYISTFDIFSLLDVNYQPILLIMGTRYQVCTYAWGPFNT